MQAFQSIPTSQLINTIAHGDCIDIMRQMPANSIDFIVTDPPYLVNFRDRTGRSIQKRRECRLAQARDEGSASSPETESLDAVLLRMEQSR